MPLGIHPKILSSWWRRLLLTTTSVRWNSQSFTTQDWDSDKGRFLGTWCGVDGSDNHFEVLVEILCGCGERESGSAIWLPGLFIYRFFRSAIIYYQDRDWEKVSISWWILVRVVSCTSRMVVLGLVLRPWCSRHLVRDFTGAPLEERNGMSFFTGAQLGMTVTVCSGAGFFWSVVGKVL